MPRKARPEPAPAPATAPGPLRPVDPPPNALRLIWVDPSSLSPNPDNWRIHTDEQTALVGDTIDDPEISWAGACLYNERTGNLLDGHLRREHAFKKMLAVPILVGSWSPEKEAAIMAILDQSTAMARVDTKKLLALVQKADIPTERAAEILKRLSERKGCVFPDRQSDGDDKQKNESTSDKPSDDDKREALRAKWGVEPGSLFFCQSRDGLRIHRILCGDATSDFDVKKLFDGKVADQVMTSPPYGDDQRAYSGDVLPWNDLMRGAFAAVPTGPDTQVFVNLGITYKDACLDFYWYEWVNWMKSRGWRPYALNVWDQKYGLPGDFHGRLAPSHEWIFHFNKNAIDPNKTVPCKGAGESTHYAQFRRPSNERGGCDVDKITQDMKIHDSVFRVQRATSPDVSHLHPAVYSVELAAEVVACYGESGDITYDPFGGSGSTLLACESLGRTGYVMEIHPPYVAINLERLAASGLIPFAAR